MPPFKAILLLLTLPLWSACVTPAPRSRPQVSENIDTMDSGFTISVREPSVRFNVLLRRFQPPAQPLPITVIYENPAAPDAPFTEESEWPAGENLLQLVSPPLHGLEAGKRYRITLTIFSDPARTSVADTHEVFILSNIDTPTPAVDPSP